MKPIVAARRALGAALIALLAGCSSGGTPPLPAGPAGSNPGSGTTQPASSAHVTFTMHWNTAAPAAASRKPAYVPATARSVSVAVNGGTPQYLNAPSMTLTIAAPAGVDTFAFAVFDEQNGQGNVLSRANVTQTVAIDTANVVSATLNGVIASLTLALSNAAPNAGAAATVTVNVAALDADGNVIVGPGDYNTPIQLSINDPTASGALSLSANLVQTPGTAAPTLTYSGATLSSATVVATASGAPTKSAVFAPTPTFYQFSLPTAGNRPGWIAAGSDGNMWFTESPGNAVARITPSGTVTEFAIPTTGAVPSQIIGASDGNLWFTEAGSTANKIAKVTTGGTFTEFSTLFAPPPADEPFGLADRGDGNIWYVAINSSRVGYQGISSGTAGETSVLTASSAPYGIAAAPDNNLYYTENATDKIGRIANLFTPQTELALTAGSAPRQIVRGPDGNLWFTENGTSKIGRLNATSFSLTGEFATLTANASPTGITVGKDGALWFTETGLDRIGRISTGGTVTEYASPVTGLGLTGIAAAPDGSLWFTEPGFTSSPGIGKLVY